MRINSMNSILCQKLYIMLKWVYDMPADAHLKPRFVFQKALKVAYFSTFGEHLLNTKLFLTITNLESNVSI